jgi:sugar phosphate permease
LVNSAFFWAYAALQIPAGWVVDRYGVKFPYTHSFVFWCMASASTAFARSITQLMALRMLLGVAESLVTPASTRELIHEVSTVQILVANLNIKIAHHPLAVRLGALRFRPQASSRADP